MSVGLFDSGISGLVASRRGLATTGHNIANVNTEGYSRQRVELAPRPGNSYGNGFIGAGVDVTTVQRLVDGFTTAQIRTSTAAFGEVEIFHRLAGQIDNLLADPDGGLSPALQSFFGAVHELAADPASLPARQVLLGEAQGLVERFHTLESRLADIGEDVEQQIKDVVGEVNALTTDIAGINARIVRAEGAAGQPANDLRDRRDQLVLDLSERVAISTVPQDDGSLNVFFTGGQALVVGQSAISLGVVPSSFDAARGEIAVQVGGASSVVTSQVSGGELAGILDFRDRVLDQAQRSLGRAAVGLVETFNTQHALGVDLAGQPGGDFFDPLATSVPTVRAHSGNTGAPPAAIDASVLDASALTTSDYRLDRVGVTYTLTRLDDGATTILSGFPGTPVTVDGLRLELTGGAIADGDRFVVQPAVRGARDIGLAVAGPERIAAAAPVRAETSLANTGDATISQPVVSSPANELLYTFTAANQFDVTDATTGATLAIGLGYVPGAPIQFNGVTVDISGAPAAGDVFRSASTVTSADPANTGTGVIGEAAVAAPDPNLADTVTIVFTGANTFDVTGATTGSPTTGVVYTSGDPVSFNGWTVTIEGNPQAGDTFTIEPNTGGVGDNRNALALAALQTSGTLDGGSASYEEAYGRLVADVGTATRQADINRAAQDALLRQAVESREAVSGVNLDEEAANLMRYQQAYEASAQVIGIADEIFQTLIDAVRR
jgi:flagellar hook-associated protein 1 FlgK